MNEEINPLFSDYGIGFRGWGSVLGNRGSGFKGRGSEIGDRGSVRGSGVGKKSRMNVFFFC